MKQSQLNEILQQHKAWYRHLGLIGERANLSGMDLSGLDLSNTCLNFAYAERTNFQRANLQNAELAFDSWKGADFRGANLEGAYFHTNLPINEILLPAPPVNPGDLCTWRTNPPMLFIKEDTNKNRALFLLQTGQVVDLPLSFKYTVVPIPSRE